MRQKDINRLIAHLHETDQITWNTENDNRASKRREKRAIEHQKRQQYLAEKNDRKSKGLPV